MSRRNVFKNNIEELEKKIDYSFNNKDNLMLALTHSSYANENKNDNLVSNERIEFLGDAVLNIIITEKIYKELSDLTEGQMTKLRANIVCEKTLEKCSKNIELGKYILFGKGEELSGGRKRTSILSDAFEALLGAIYIDGGMDKVKKILTSQMDKLVEDASKGMIFLDYKTHFQEIVQKDSEKKISYEIIEEKGPDHDKLFVSQVKVSDNVVGVGEGRSKKEAEQNAAKAALKNIDQ